MYKVLNYSLWFVIYTPTVLFESENFSKEVLKKDLFSTPTNQRNYYSVELMITVWK